MRSKTNAYKVSSSGTDFDIFIFVETNLQDDISSNEIFDDNYIVFRHDRHLAKTPKCEGGGVLIAVKKIFSAESVNLVEDSVWYVEQLAVSLSLGDSRKLYILAVYLPHWSHNENRFDAFVTSLKKLNDHIKAEDMLLCIGDFNLTDVIWSEDADVKGSFYPINCHENSNGKILGGIFSCGLFQISSIKNENDRMLDLAFFNNMTDIQIHKCDPLYSSESHHFPFNIIIPCESSTCESFASIPVFNFRKADVMSLSMYLLALNWSKLFVKCASVNLLDHLNFISDRHWSIIQNMFFVKYMNDFPADCIDILDINVYIFYIVVYDAFLYYVPYSVRRKAIYPHFLAIL